MKRSLSWLCLCSVSLLTLAACGDDDAMTGTGDGGVDGGIVTVNDKVDELGDMVTGLSGDLDMLDEKTDDLADTLDMLETMSRVVSKTSRTPRFVSCSIGGESCDARRHHARQRPASTPSSSACATKSSFAAATTSCATSSASASLTKPTARRPSPISSTAASAPTSSSTVFARPNDDVVDYLIDIAQALNERDVKLEIDQDNRECLEDARSTRVPEVQRQSRPPSRSTSATSSSTSRRCRAIRDGIVKGLQKENEPCGLTFVHECEAGLICRKTTEVCVPGAAGCMGICAKSAEAGDRCTSDAECDSATTELYCNRSDNTCEERAEEGEDCAYVNLFSTLSPGVDATYLQNPAAMAVECKRGLTCDPKELVCVNRCSEGSLCRPYGGRRRLGWWSHRPPVVSLERLPRRQHLQRDREPGPPSPRLRRLPARAAGGRPLHAVAEPRRAVPRVRERSLCARHTARLLPRAAEGG